MSQIKAATEAHPQTLATADHSAPNVKQGPSNTTASPLPTNRAALAAEVVAEILEGWATIDQVVKAAHNVPGLSAHPVASLREALAEAVDAGTLTVTHNNLHTIWYTTDDDGDRCMCGGSFTPGDGPDWVCVRCGKRDFETYPERT